MSLHFLFLLALLCPALALAKPSSKSEYCYSTHENPYLFFSTKTAYDYNHGDLNEDQVPATCTPIQFWGLIRHGTRYPSDTEIEEFTKLEGLLNQILLNEQEGRTELCEQDLALLRTWTWDTSIDVSIAKDLAPQGFKDMKGLANRFKEKFPQLFIVPYKKKNYYFRHTNSVRTKDSFEGYVEALFGSDCEVKVKESNKIFKEYKKCTTWNDEDTSEEYETFITTSLYKEMVGRVSKRLGFTENLNVTTIEAMHLECAFEKAWYINEPSKWCTAFTEDDLLILEYSEDLQEYYESGYGREKSNKALGCPILNDLFTRLENTITGASDDEPKAAVHFTHSTALLQFMMNLGLYEDEEPLTGYNYAKQQNRRWRSSLFGQFATNVAAVLYKCTDTEEPYQIEVLIDERPENICSENKFCSWSEFVERFQPTAASCNLDFCEAKLC